MLRCAMTHTYLYGMRNRPPALGSVPRDHAGSIAHAAFRFGALVMERRLSAEEMSRYELVKIADAEDLAAVACAIKARLEQLGLDGPAIDFAQRRYVTLIESTIKGLSVYCTAEQVAEALRLTKQQH